jgi:hypothetical protein
MSTNVKKLMNELKDDASFGGLSFDEIENGRVALMNALDSNEAQRPVYTWRDKTDFAMFFVMDSVARPVAVGISSIALALSGWVVAVNAASSSVPGDKLYPIKIATEKVQLQFTTSSEQRAKLHVEFAGRRLEEASEIKTSTRAGKSVRVHSAIESFRHEMASVDSELAQVSENNPSAAPQLISFVNQKTNEYVGVIREQVAATEEVQTEQEIRDNVEAAQEEAVTVNQNAVLVLVETHEQADANASTDDLKEIFRRDLGDVQGQLAIVESRLDVVKLAVANNGGLDQSLVANINDVVSKIENRLLDVPNQIADATNFLAVGGYRATFDTMSELKDTMSVVHNLLAQLEVQISVAIQELGEQQN